MIISQEPTAPCHVAEGHVLLLRGLQPGSSDEWRGQKELRLLRHRKRPAETGGWSAG